MYTIITMIVIESTEAHLWYCVIDDKHIEFCRSRKGENAIRIMDLLNFHNEGDK